MEVPSYSSARLALDCLTLCTLGWLCCLYGLSLDRFVELFAVLVELKYKWLIVRCKRMKKRQLSYLKSPKCALDLVSPDRQSDRYNPPRPVSVRFQFVDYIPPRASAGNPSSPWAYQPSAPKFLVAKGAHTILQLTSIYNFQRIIYIFVHQTLQKP